MTKEHMNVELTIKNMSEINNTDRREIHHGFDSGSYCNAYVTEDWDVAKKEIESGYTGFYRMAFLVGFFGTYELHEIGDELVRDEVEHYREVFRRVFPEIAID